MGYQKRESRNSDNPGNQLVFANLKQTDTKDASKSWNEKTTDRFGGVSAVAQRDN